MLMFLVDPDFQKALFIVFCILIPFLILCIVVVAAMPTSYTADTIAKLASQHRRSMNSSYRGGIC